jgi:hypothetical protein
MSDVKPPVFYGGTCLFYFLAVVFAIILFGSTLIWPQADGPETYCETFGPEGSDAWTECAFNEILKNQEQNPRP